MQICPVHHGSKRWIPHTQFATPGCVRTLKSVNFIQALGGNSLWRKRCSASLNCQQYYRVSYVYITSILTIQTCNIYIIYNVYTQQKIGIYLTYTINIPFRFSVYTVQNSLIYMVYAWYVSCIYKKITWDIYNTNHIYKAKYSSQSIIKVFHYACSIS